MKIIIDTESEKKEILRQQKEEALHKQSSEIIELICDPIFLIPATIIYFIVFWVGPLGDVCRRALANGG